MSYVPGRLQELAFIALLFSFFFFFSILPYSRHRLCAWEGEVFGEVCGFFRDLGPLCVCTWTHAPMHKHTPPPNTPKSFLLVHPKVWLPSQCLGLSPRLGVSGMGRAEKGVIISRC